MSGEHEHGQGEACSNEPAASGFARSFPHGEPPVAGKTASIRRTRWSPEETNRDRNMKAKLCIVSEFGLPLALPDATETPGRKSETPIDRQKSGNRQERRQ